MPAAGETETRILATGEMPGRPTAPAKALDGRRASGKTKELSRPQSRTGIRMAAASVIAVALAVSAYLFLSPGKSATAKNSIAVLPFANAGGDPNMEYLSDGITESLINSLSQLPNLAVKARSTVFRYKGQQPDPQKVGSELNVQAVLNGRVVQRGDDLTLSLEMVDAKSGDHIWGEQYNRKLSDLVTLQGEIARDVTNRLRVKLSGADEQRLAKNYTANTEAYQLYLRGRFHWNRRSAADVRKSMEYFQQAINRDPTYALAYAGLAEAHILMPGYAGVSPHDAFPKAKAAAAKALEIDDTLAEAHTALADVRYEYDWDFAGAEGGFKRAIELNPNNPTAHHWYGEYLMAEQRFEEALAELKRAQELDPLSMIINSLLGLIYQFMGRHEEALEQLKKTIEMDPNFPRAHLFLAQTYEHRGLFEEAISEYEKLSLLVGMPAEEVSRDARAMRQAYETRGASGYYRKQIEIYERLRAAKSPFAPPPFVLAGLYAQLGEKEQALALLEKSYEQHDPALVRLKAGIFDPRRSDPRFADLMHKVGFPQ